LAASLATRMWQAIASSHPPPSAKPLTAATVGLGDVSNLRIIAWPRRASARASVASAATISEMSAPATKARPAPVSTTAATSSRARASSIAASSSAIVASLSALSFSGRLTVIVAIRSATSTVTNW
jgi:hypothetical protein